jgi:hypothetical protein
VKEPKVRKEWKISPEVRIHKVKKDYKRSEEDKIIEDALREMEEDQDFII